MLKYYEIWMYVLRFRERDSSETSSCLLISALDTFKVENNVFMRQCLGYCLICICARSSCVSSLREKPQSLFKGSCQTWAMAIHSTMNTEPKWRLKSSICACIIMQRHMPSKTATHMPHPHTLPPVQFLLFGVVTSQWFLSLKAWLLGSEQQSSFTFEEGANSQEHKPNWNCTLVFNLLLGLLRPQTTANIYFKEVKWGSFVLPKIN